MNLIFVTNVLFFTRKPLTRKPKILLSHQNNKLNKSNSGARHCLTFLLFLKAKIGLNKSLRRKLKAFSGVFI
jgi:hypothetical protein